MKGIAFLFLAIIGISSGAMANVSMTLGVDPFATIKGWEAHAEPVAVGEIIGLYEGRCFNAEHPKTAQKSLLAAASHTLDNDYGPGFPKAIELKVVPAMYRSTKPRPEVFLQEMLDNWETIGLPLKALDPAVWTRGSWSGEVKKYGDYLVTLWQWSPGSQIVEACYFYKKLNGPN